jgi:hypothetical protein
MSASDTDYLIRDNTTINASKSTAKKFIWLAVIFLLGVAVGSIPAIIISKRQPNVGPNPPNPPLPPEPPTWNVTDYQSNSDYYNQFTSLVDFNQTHNLRLDRLSSPQFHPSHGKTVIYLRKQYHMPDLNGSTTTLHWIDLSTNQTIQLTKPIWGINDQQFYWIDSKTILFLSNRGSSSLTQIFQLNLPDDINNLKDNYLEPIQITFYPLNIDNLLVNKQGTRLAFSCQVYPNMSIEDTFSMQNNQKTSGSSVYKFNKLFIRHWDEYMIGYVIIHLLFQ